MCLDVRNPPFFGNTYDTSEPEHFRAAPLPRVSQRVEPGFLNALSPVAQRVERVCGPRFFRSTVACLPRLIVSLFYVSFPGILSFFILYLAFSLSL